MGLSSMSEQIKPGSRVVNTDSGNTGIVIASCDGSCWVEPDIPWSAIFQCPTWKLAVIAEAS